MSYDDSIPYMQTNSPNLESENLDFLNVDYRYCDCQVGAELYRP